MPKPPRRVPPVPTVPERQMFAIDRRAWSRDLKETRKKHCLGCGAWLLKYDDTALIACSGDYRTGLTAAQVEAINASDPLRVPLEMVAFVAVTCRKCSTRHGAAGGEVWLAYF